MLRWTDFHWTGIMRCQMTLGYAKQLLSSALKWMSTSREERKKARIEGSFQRSFNTGKQHSKSGSFLRKVLGWENSKSMKIHREKKNKLSKEQSYEQRSLVLASPKSSSTHVPTALPQPHTCTSVVFMLKMFFSEVFYFIPNPYRHYLNTKVRIIFSKKPHLFH